MRKKEGMKERMREGEGWRKEGKENARKEGRKRREGGREREKGRKVFECVKLVGIFCFLPLLLRCNGHAGLPYI